jgi:pyruvate formate lyase activating enzyme
VLAGCSSRREFLRTCARCGALLAASAWLGDTPRGFPLLVRAAAGAEADPLATLVRDAPRARYWVSTADPAGCAECHPPGTLDPQAPARHRRALIRCELCARECVLADGERGRCRARIHVHGELRSLVYGRPIAIHVDPIEKKPFYHFLPGRMAYSIATAGCPLRCKFCQNWEISQARPEDVPAPPMPPAAVVQGAARDDAPIIAFTYNEPTVFTEYLTDIARAARPQGLRSVLVSCGFTREAPLTEMCETLDAIKIDLKGLSERFYHEVCDAELQPVLRSIRQVAKSRTHLEIVNLVVPTLNDSPAMFSELSKWVAGELGPDVPIHFTRFHPDYQLAQLPDTPVSTLERARETAMASGLHYVYVGNVPGHPGNHTYCPRCGAIVIRRDGFFVTAVHLTHGSCAACGQGIAGVWD